MKVRVDWRTSVAVTGTVLRYLSMAMLVPLVVAFVYGDDLLVFGATIFISLGIGSALERADPDPDLGPREALLLVAIVWFVVAAVGALPYVIAGWGTASTLAHPVNALFESMSGFTTTGATVMGDISTDQHSHALLMWRQVTQWLGGMGIIVLMVAILPELAVNGAELMQSEAPGPSLQKLTPRIAETARVLWLVYLSFTVLLAIILYGLSLVGLAPNMDLFNAIAHAFSTLPTGGFSPQSESIGAFSPAVQWAILPFMVIAGTNFALFWHVFDRDLSALFEDTEFRWYISAVVTLTLVLFGLLFTGTAPELTLGGMTAGAPENALRQAAFQVGSLMNSTGFATSDFAQWGTEGRVLLLFAMFIGGSAGSTGGGIKVIRWVIVMKVVRRELFSTAHPEAVRPIRLGKSVVNEDGIRGVMAFTLLYIALFGVAAVVISLDASRVGVAITPIEAFSASLATIGNIGPGFGMVGPFGSYLMFPDSTKLLLVFMMWIGRLEILPVLVLFTGGYWQR